MQAVRYRPRASSGIFDTDIVGIVGDGRRKRGGEEGRGKERE